MDKNYDFCGWATKNDILCEDGRTIKRDAFKHNSGKTVPLVYNHQHNDLDNVLGHAILENRPEGVYAYGFFNPETKQGQQAKACVAHGDLKSLSIWANRLQQKMGDVTYGDIKELSLVLAGSNKGAYIQSVIAHGSDVDGEDLEEVYIAIGENIELAHSDDISPKDSSDVDSKDAKETSDNNPNKAEIEESNEKTDKTIRDVMATLNNEQNTAVYSIINQLVDDEKPSEEESTKKPEKEQNDKGGNIVMKQNAFDKSSEVKGDVLSHSAQKDILTLAKNTSVGSLQNAIRMYADDNASTLAHGIDGIESLFPDYKDVYPGAPERLTRDLGWVNIVIQKIHKSPISRIRTRQADVRGNDLRAHGYVKGSKKTASGNMKLLTRTTDPQTVYRRDALHRDDLIDLVDFDVVTYQYETMKENLNEDLALSAMIGDGREDGDADKISEEHIRSILNDNDLYSIHYDVDVEAAKKEIQGTNTGANFGINYIYAEAIVNAALYSREKYKGSGALDFFVTPHALNVMLLARDLNGRRIYASKTELEAALNVNSIITAEQFEGVKRTTKDDSKKKLIGIFVNLTDYSFGATKGGEVTRFNQFDIDFNQEKYLIEARLSGALTRPYSAIVLEEPVGATPPEQE